MDQLFFMCIEFVAVHTQLLHWARKIVRVRLRIGECVAVVAGVDKQRAVCELVLFMTGVAFGCHTVIQRDRGGGGGDTRCSHVRDSVAFLSCSGFVDRGGSEDDGQ